MVNPYQEMPGSALASAGRVQIFRLIAWFLGGGAVAVALALVFTPWQQ